jgi:pimeloyl-ACP methyl ester carboxylesterase
MPMIDARAGVELEYDLFGDRRSPLLMLVSGAGSPSAFWPDWFCRDLAASGLLVGRYSHRDTGRSTHFDDPYDIQELLTDLLGLIAALEKPAAHLAGHSMGGYLAQLAACRHPDIVTSVASISAGSTVDLEEYAGLGMTGPSDETWRQLMKNQPTGSFETDLPGWLASWRFLNGRHDLDEELAIAYTRALYEGDPRNCQAATNHIHAMGTVPASLVDELTWVACRFLVLHGSDDPLVPIDNGRATARIVPGSEFVPLEGAGHMFFNRGTWDRIGECLVRNVERST